MTDSPEITNERTFANLLAVLDYLESEGWRIARTSLYRHADAGKLLPGPDGSYSLKSVDKYAKAFLKQKATGRKVDQKMDELQRKKLEMELKNLELDNQRKQRANEKEMGLYIPREQMELEFAALAGIFDAAMKNWIQSGAADWIRLVGGDMKKVGELITVLNRDLDGHINNLARDREYDVIIDEDEISEGGESDAEND